MLLQVRSLHRLGRLIIHHQAVSLLIIALFSVTFITTGVFSSENAWSSGFSRALAVATAKARLKPELRTFVVPQVVEAKWQQSGLDGLEVHAFAASGNVVLTGTSDGIYRSINEGASWTKSPYASPNDGPARRALALVRDSDSTFTAGTDGAGVWISNLGAERWTNTEFDLPVRGERILSLAINERAKFAGTAGNGIFRQFRSSSNNSLLWRYAGLAGETITAMATSGDRVFIATEMNGLMLSVNDGNSWINIENGLPADSRILTLAVDGKKVYAGTTVGLFRSTDQGENWSEVQLPSSNEINAVLADGANLFVGTSGNGVLVSTDSGVSWNPFNTNLTNLNVLSLITYKGKLFAGTKGGGVFVARLVADTNLPPSADPQSVELDEDATAAIKLTGKDPNNDPIVFKIIDFPKNGTLIGDAPNLTYQPLPNYFGADSFSFITNDGKADSSLATVTIKVRPVEDPIQLSIDGDKNAIVGGLVTLRIYGFDPDGDIVKVVAASLPQGAVFDQQTEKSRAIVNWIPAEAGTYTFSFTATEENGTSLTSEFKVDVMLSQQTSSWSQVSVSADKRVEQMLVSGTTIYLSLSGLGSALNPMLLRSNNNGQSWVDISGGLPGNSDFYRIIADGLKLYVTSSGGIFRSNNSGLSWENISSGKGLPDNGRPLFIAAQGDKLLAGNETKIFVSLNAGSTWTEVTNNLPIKPSGSRFDPGGEIRTATISGDALLISLSSGAVANGPITFRSIDNGVSWQSASSGLAGAVSINRFFNDGERLYCLTAFYLNFSSDHGANWGLLNPLFSPSRPVISPNIAAAAKEGLLMVLYREGGIQLSLDNGQNWTAFSSIPGEEINALAIGSSSFFAITNSGKLFSRPRK